MVINCARTLMLRSSLLATFVAASAAWHVGPSVGRRSTSPQCNADVRAPELVALTMADVRSMADESMNDLEELVEELEAAAANHVDSEGRPHVHL